MTDNTEQGIRVGIDVSPGGDTHIFRYGAADDVLRVLVDAHEREFTILELASITEHSRSTVWRAISLLETVGAVRVEETPQRNYVSIDPTRLEKDDPVLGIEQVEYHDPIRAFIERVESTIAGVRAVDSLLGVLVFGSVARGGADRKSDIDVFVLVAGDRTEARRVISDVAVDLGEQRFGGDRYSFEPFVETPESAERSGPKLHTILRDGITVYGSDRLQNLRTAILSDEH